MQTQTVDKSKTIAAAALDSPEWLDRSLYPFESRFVEVEGERIHYIDEGEGPTLLFLHANPLWSFTYRDIIKDLRRDFRCVAFDYPGFGLSGLSDRWKHTLAADSRLVESFIDKLRLSNVILYGHDASCSIGLGAVARRPELFRAAIVSNSFAWPIESYAEVRRFVKAAASAPFGFMIQNFNLLVYYVAANAFYASGRKMSRAEKAAFLGPFQDPSRRRVQQELFRSILNSREYLADLEQRLGDLKQMPVMILFGDDDATYRAGWAQKFEQIFPKHRTVILKGGHHFPPEYDPEAIVKSIRDWYPRSSDVSQRLDTFEQYRPLLFSIAYRMLGSAMEAEDAVQEAYLRWQAVDPQEIRDPKNFLATVVTRLCLNHLDRAREKREEYIGPWLPEPVPTEGDPAWVAPQGKPVEYESISMAFLVLLERLNPEERAVFLLREVFQYPYPEIAGMIQKSEDACRQVFHRAKVQLAANRPRFAANPLAHQKVFGAFLQAIQNGDLDRLKGLLVADASLWADGGGRIKGAATRPIHGAEAVAQFLLASTRFAPQGLTPSIEEINKQPAIVLRSQGQAYIVVMLELEDEKINVVRLFGNPQKLSAL